MLERIGVTRDLIEEKHAAIERIGSVTKFLINCFLAVKPESATQTDFKVALLREVSRSRCGWEGLNDELRLSVDMLYDGREPQSVDPIPLAVSSASGSDKSRAEFEEALAKDAEAKNEGVAIAPFMKFFAEVQDSLVTLSSRARRVEAARTTTHAVH